MKKFKGILATMLAVAAVVVYAPTEAYAANTYTCTWKLSYDGTNITDNGFEGQSSFVFTTGDEMNISVTNSGTSQCNCSYFFYYKDDTTKLSSGSLGVDPASSGVQGEATVAEKLSYDGISSMFSHSDARITDVPEKIKVVITKEIKETDYGKRAYIYITFSDAGDDSSDTASASSVNASAHVHTWKYGTIFDATEDTDGLEGYYCSCGATKETTVIPSITAIYKNRYTQMDQAGKGEVITLKMGEWNTYSKEFMQHLISATERGVTVKLDYKYEKKNYVTTVPAGTTMDLAYDYYGPLFIQSLFETTKLN